MNKQLPFYLTLSSKQKYSFSFLCVWHRFSEAINVSDIISKMASFKGKFFVVLKSEYEVLSFGQTKFLNVSNSNYIQNEQIVCPQRGRIQGTL